jgi:hypothetical protein
MIVRVFGHMFLVILLRDIARVGECGFIESDIRRKAEYNHKNMVEK